MNKRNKQLQMLFKIYPEFVTDKVEKVKHILPRMERPSKIESKKKLGNVVAQGLHDEIIKNIIPLIYDDEEIITIDQAILDLLEKGELIESYELVKYKRGTETKIVRKYKEISKIDKKVKELLNSYIDYVDSNKLILLDYNTYKDKGYSELIEYLNLLKRMVTECKYLVDLYSLYGNDSERVTSLNYLNNLIFEYNVFETLTSGYLNFLEDLTVDSGKDEKENNFILFYIDISENIIKLNIRLVDEILDNINRFKESLEIEIKKKTSRQVELDILTESQKYEVERKVKLTNEDKEELKYIIKRKYNLYDEIGDIFKDYEYDSLTEKQKKIISNKETLNYILKNILTNEKVFIKYYKLLLEDEPILETLKQQGKGLYGMTRHYVRYNNNTPPINIRYS